NCAAATRSTTGLTIPSLHCRLRRPNDEGSCRIKGRSPPFRRIDQQPPRPVSSCVMRPLLAAALLLFLSGPNQVFLAARPPTLPSPTSDIPCDDDAEATTQVMVAQEVLTFLVTAQSYWGHNETALRDAVTGELVRDDQGILIYRHSLGDHAVLEGYEFRDGSL